MKNLRKNRKNFVYSKDVKNLELEASKTRTEKTMNET